MGIEYKLRSLIKLHIQPGISLIQTTTYSVRHLLVTLVEYVILDTQLVGITKRQKRTKL